MLTARVALLSLLASLPFVLPTQADDQPPDTPKTLWDGTGTGGLRVPGAEIHERTGTATAFGSFFSQGALLSPGDASRRTRYGFGVHYAPQQQLVPFGIELGTNVRGSRVHHSLANPQTLSAFGDLVFTAKGSYALNERWTTGVRTELRLFSGVSGESGYGDTASYAAAWVSTWRFGDLAVHGLAGFYYDRTVNFARRFPSAIERFAWGQTDYNQVLYGLSLNYETRPADYTLEASGELPVGMGAPGFGAAPLRLTPGVRLRPWGPAEIHLAADFSLTANRDPGIPAQPAYDLLVALRWQFASTGTSAQAIIGHPEPVSQPSGLPTPMMAEPTKPTAAVTPQPTTGSVTGRVLNLSTAEPVSGATVTAYPSGLKTQTYPDGTYALAGLPSGDITLRIEAPGLIVAHVNATVVAGDTTILDALLRPQPTTARLAVWVLDAAGQPLSDAEIRIDGKPVGRTAADGHGVIETTPGTHVLAVVKPGYEGTPTSLQLQAGEQRREQIVLKAEPRPGFVEVKVVDESRQPIAATIVIEGQPDSQRKVEPSSGSTTTYSLKPGTYRVRVEASGYSHETQTVTVEEDGEAALRFKLRKL